MCVLIARHVRHPLFTPAWQNTRRKTVYLQRGRLILSLRSIRPVVANRVERVPTTIRTDFLPIWVPLCSVLCYSTPACACPQSDLCPNATLQMGSRPVMYRAPKYKTKSHSGGTPKALRKASLLAPLPYSYEAPRNAEQQCCHGRPARFHSIVRRCWLSLADCPQLCFLLSLPLPLLLLLHVKCHCWSLLLLGVIACSASSQTLFYTRSLGACTAHPDPTHQRSQHVAPSLSKPP